MILIYNTVGIVMVAVGGILIFFAVVLPPPWRGLLLPACGLVWIVWDLAWRRGSGAGAYLAPRGGGHLYFVPVWVLGVLMLLGAFVEHRSAREREAENRATDRRIHELRSRLPAPAEPAATEPAAPATRTER